MLCSVGLEYFLENNFDFVFDDTNSADVNLGCRLIRLDRAVKSTRGKDLSNSAEYISINFEYASLGHIIC